MFMEKDRNEGRALVVEDSLGSEVDGSGSMGKDADVEGQGRTTLIVSDCQGNGVNSYNFIG